MSSASSDRPQARAYRSPLRTEQAAETRSRILDAAAELFASRGYGGTSLAQIADQAGVSIETVKAGGAKRELLLASFESSFAGIEGLVSLADFDPIATITADTNNSRYLAGIMHFIAESNRRSSRLWIALVAAAAADHSLAKALDGLQKRRRSDILVLVDELRSRGMAPREVPREAHADALTFILSPEGYNQLVLDAGWSQSDYESWLTRAVTSLPAGP